MAPRSAVLAEARAFLPEFLTGVVMYGVGFGLDNVNPTRVPFIEQDPALSLPARSSTVPTWALALLSFLLPCLIIIAVAGTKAGRSRLGCAGTFRTLFYLVAALATVFGINALGTNVIKNAAGRPRPSFFDICNYGGYSAAVAAGGLPSGGGTPTPEAAAYLAATVAGAFGSLDKCGAPIESVREGLRSFPSGHASIAFGGQTFLMLFLRWALRVRRGTWSSPAALLCAAPLVLACYISLTRIFDNKHTFTDISVGAAVGALSAVLAWRQYRAYAAVRDPMHGPNGVAADAETAAEAAAHAPLALEGADSCAPTEAAAAGSSAGRPHAASSPAPSCPAPDGGRSSPSSVGFAAPVGSSPGSCRSPTPVGSPVPLLLSSGGAAAGRDYGSVAPPSPLARALLAASGDAPTDEEAGTDRSEGGKVESAAV